MGNLVTIATIADIERLRDWNPNNLVRALQKAGYETEVPQHHIFHAQVSDVLGQYITEVRFIKGQISVLTRHYEREDAQKISLGEVVNIYLNPGKLEIPLEIPPPYFAVTSNEGLEVVTAVFQGMDVEVDLLQPTRPLEPRVEREEQDGTPIF